MFCGDSAGKTVRTAAIKRVGSIRSIASDELWHSAAILFLAEGVRRHNYVTDRVRLSNIAFINLQHR